MKYLALMAGFNTI